MNDIKPIDTLEQTKYKAEQLIETILLQTNYFEQSLRVKPTVFISYDLFALIAAGNRDVLLYRMDKNQPVNTICGYDIEILSHGEELLYVGYKVLF